jgi:hypothetical protein
MSGYKPVGAELLFATYQAATISVVSASAVTITAGWPGLVVPGGYFSNDRGDWCSSLRFRMGGFLTATATVPTWAFGIAWVQGSTTFSAAAPLATVSNTVTPTAGSGSWKMEVDIGLRTLGIGGASTLVTHGEVSSNLFGSTTPVLAPGGSGNTVTTIDKQNPIYLWPYLLLGAATAGNQVTSQFGKLMGEN